MPVLQNPARRFPDSHTLLSAFERLGDVYIKPTIATAQRAHNERHTLAFRLAGTQALPSKFIAAPPTCAPTGNDQGSVFSVRLERISINQKSVKRVRVADQHAFATPSSFLLLTPLLFQHSSRLPLKTHHSRPTGRDPTRKRDLDHRYVASGTPSSPVEQEHFG